MPDDKTLGQTYYEEVEALKASGVKNADAIRTVAEKNGKTENAVRGSLYQYKSRQDDGSSSSAASTTTTRSRRRMAAPQSVDDLMNSARRSLEQALALVDGEVEQAKAALDAAQIRYDEVVSGVKDKKTDIEKKLEALA